MLNGFRRKVKQLYYNFFLSPEQQARKIGVKIGKNCFIATRNWPSEPYLISIGNNVAVTQGVYIHTHGGSRVARQFHPNFDVFGKVEIKDWAYIGSGSQIMPGVTIGNGSLIAAGSVVTHSIPDNQVWGGVPAKFICTVEEFIEKNKPYNLDSKNLSPEKKKELLLSLPDYKFIKK